MRISRRLALAISLSFLSAVVVASPVAADDVRFSGDHACPDLYPIKQMVVDARSGSVQTICVTQYQWDIEMIGGATHEKWIASGKTYDAHADISAWKAEKAGIELLRTTAEAEAKAAADADPGLQVCKSWNYTSIYNGSGGGSICTITEFLAPSFTDEEFNATFQMNLNEFDNDPQYKEVRYQINNDVFVYSPQERIEILSRWATWTAATQLAKQHALTAAEETPNRQRCVQWSRNGENGRECAQVNRVEVPVVDAPQQDDSESTPIAAEKRLLIKPNTLVATIGSVPASATKYVTKLDRSIPKVTKKSSIKIPKASKGLRVTPKILSGSCSVKGRAIKFTSGTCEVEFLVATKQGTVRLTQSVRKN